MQQGKFVLTALALAVLTALAGCGGSGSGSGSAGDQTLNTKFSSQVTFGDSLSDVGTYAVGAVAAAGGGKYTINGDNTAIDPTLTGKNWTELIAAQLGLPAPCAAETGLTGTTAGFMVPIVFHPGCFGYAQGGSRVTELIGPGNSGSGLQPMGALTVPVAVQIARHLATLPGGKFKGDEIVFVMAGGNDAIFLAGKVGPDALGVGTTAGVELLVKALYDMIIKALSPSKAVAATTSVGIALVKEKAKPGYTLASLYAAAVAALNKAVKIGADNATVLSSLYAQVNAEGHAIGNAYFSSKSPAMVALMTTAGANLVTLVKTQLLANGARYVTVNNLPDLASTPLFLAYDPAVQVVINDMVTAFNKQLSIGFAGESRVLLVDVYAVSHDQAINPAPYGLTNSTDTACDLTAPSNSIEASLECNASNLKPGDVTHYSFADDVHPTPYNNFLLARYVAAKLVLKGWL